MTDTVGRQKGKCFPAGSAKHIYITQPSGNRILYYTLSDGMRTAYCALSDGERIASRPLPGGCRYNFMWKLIAISTSFCISLIISF